MKKKIWGENCHVCIRNAKYKYKNVNKGYVHCLTNTVAEKKDEEGKKGHRQPYLNVYLYLLHILLCYMFQHYSLVEIQNRRV
jgi:hypothetical protein